MDDGETEEQKFERVLMNASMLMVCVLGLVFNVMAMVTVRLNPILRSSFGILCFSHCTANFGILFVFLFWTTPLTFTESSNNPSLQAKLCGVVLTLLWYGGVYTHLAISVNRFIAIIFAHSSASILTTKKTIFIVILVWFIGFCHTIPNFWRE
ncbi:hypothetical protein OESDEN_19706 [Oesophagostomum dentatum]|uniref:G-protein coupled receptors family 1 profile domain-containing protein n=1 Tax=Oesophagostomum dentatum TaxID=61180 RepID=A0A0B1SAS5_OESDE|nr:hypothetical protein OESDEN_19706 [Oesophagostomum dentatum]